MRDLRPFYERSFKKISSSRKKSYGSWDCIETKKVSHKVFNRRLFLLKKILFTTLFIIRLKLFGHEVTKLKVSKNSDFIRST